MQSFSINVYGMIGIGGMVIGLTAAVAAIVGLLLCYRRTGNRGFIWLMIAVGAWPLLRAGVQLGVAFAMRFTKGGPGRLMSLVALSNGVLNLAGAVLLVIGVFVTLAGFRSARHESDDSWSPRERPAGDAPPDPDGRPPVQRRAR